MAAAVLAERRHHQGSRQGRSKIAEPRFAPPPGSQHGNDQGQAIDQGQAADEIKDDTAVHDYSLPLKYFMTFLEYSVWMKRMIRSPAMRTDWPLGI